MKAAAAAAINSNSKLFLVSSDNFGPRELFCRASIFFCCCHVARCFFSADKLPDVLLMPASNFSDQTNLEAKKQSGQDETKTCDAEVFSINNRPGSLLGH